MAGSAAGDTDAATAALDRAVSHAEPAGYVRAFLDEGPRMVNLLKVAARRVSAPAYERVLLAHAVSEPRVPSGSQPLVEPLSEREIDVLRLLRGDLTGPDIANELVVALSTVRSHTKSIYAKLGVNSRRAAVRRAEELGLL
jgi:LuxR family maltose regulon positive regulatory protein